MKNPLTRDPDAALDRARSDLAGVDAELITLQAERAAKLLGDDIGVVEQVDRKIDGCRRSALILRERIAALEARQAERLRQEVEAGRAAAIAATRKKIAARAALAADLEAAVRKVGDALAALMKNSEDLVADWPDTLARPAVMNDRMGIRAELAHLMFVHDLPTPVRPPRFDAPSITAAVDQFGAALIAGMEAARPSDEKEAA